MAHAVDIKRVSASGIQKIQEKLGLTNPKQVEDLALKLLKLIVDARDIGAVPMLMMHNDDPAPERIYLVNGF